MNKGAKKRATKQGPKSRSGNNSKNLRDTPMRRQVMKVFSSCREPLSAKDIKSKIPGSDTVTVYRTIEALVSAGKAKRVDLGGRAAMYEGTDRHHHHIICTYCGKIEDFEDCGLSKVEKTVVSRSRSFAKIIDHSFELFGICTSCNRSRS